MPSVGVPQWIADGMVASVEMNSLLRIFSANSYMGVSKNRGTPKWMVKSENNGKPYQNG